MKKVTLFGLVTIVHILPAYSQVPDAGDVIREVEQGIMPENISSPIQVSTESSFSEDLTPIKVDEIILKGQNVLNKKDLQPLLDDYIGKTTTFGGLQLLTQRISQKYHSEGYPLATVIIPAQKIENGVVVLNIIEGEINQVVYQNKSRISDQTLSRYTEHLAQSNQALKQTDSERALLLVKDLSGTNEVNYRLIGAEKGAALSVELNSSPAFNGSVSVDNYGSDSTGEWRTRAEANLNSPFGRGERISLQAMSSFKGVDYAKLSSDIPLGYDGLNLNIGVSHTTYDLGGDFKNLDATGNANIIGAGLRYPITRSNNSNLWLTVDGEYRDLKDEIGVTNTVTEKSLKAVKFGINGYSQDDILNGGYTQWSLINTLGDLDIDSADAKAIDTASSKTQGDYHKINGVLARTQFLTPRLSLYGGIQGQWSNKNLDSAEQFSLGGVDSVAAYHSNDVSADIGIIGQLEARYALTPNVSVSAFYDAGRAKLRKTPYTNDENFINLHGGGIGLYSQYNNLFLQSKVAWQGSDDDFINDDDPRWWLKAGYIF